MGNEDEGSSDDLTVMKKAQKDMERNIPFAIEWLKVVESSPTRSNHETSTGQHNYKQALKVADRALSADATNIRKRTDMVDVMVDNLKELRKKEKGESRKGRMLTNDIEELLNTVEDDVSQAIINYETSITNQKPSTSTIQ